ncbi:MAG: polysaccharide deacetylase, partial [Selenomonadaceae bacterium]|nr:polysaccharide deacetylase [Selenomonadaceae bacterium]
QFQRTDDIIMEQIGVRPLIIRAPGGTCGAFNADYWDMVKSSGYVEHDWNVLTRDAESGGKTAAAQIANVQGQMEANGDLKSVILLMHSTSAKDATVEALPEIIHYFKDRGYTFGVVTPMTPQPW